MATEEMHGDGIRICYRSFTDPAVDAPYFTRLTDEIKSLAGHGSM